MANFFKKITEKQISRRTFIAATAAGTAGLALAGCGTSLTTAGPNFDAAAINGEGQWITAACWHNCGGRCLNKALVIDGVVLRQKTDDTHEDSPDYPQQRGCLRGRSQRQHVFGADRLKYPMKRKHWEPGGGDKSLRGKDEWVRISWDEALDILASETKRIKETYGNRSIYSGSCEFSIDTEVNRTLNLYGGCSTGWGTTSLGSWNLTPSKIGFSHVHTKNDRFDYRNADTVIMLGINPAWSGGGNPSYHHWQVKKAGAEFIGIDPFYNSSYSMLDAEWIPVRPGTDTALLLAVAYVLITEDDPITNPLIDWDFLKRCTIGFDASSVPAGENPQSNFKDYVLGTYDGMPKTPEWASEICGAHPAQISQLALKFGKNNKVAFLVGCASARTRNTDNLPQLVMTIGAMTGHFGKSGHMVGTCWHDNSVTSGPTLVKPGSDGVPFIENPVDDCLNDAEAWTAILDGTYTSNGYYEYLPGEKRNIDIRMIYHAGGDRLQNRDGMIKGIEAHRKVEFVVSQSLFLHANAKYADLVLPVTSQWERVGGLLVGNREMLIMYSNITKPLYEAKDDQWIAMELAKRLGINEKEVYPIDPKQQFFNRIAGSTVINEDGKTEETLVTITAADIAEWGVEGKPQQGRISLKEFQEKGVYQIERYPGDNYEYIAYEDFVKDPENNPLPTSASGKMEIYSKELADVINKMGYSKIDPIPTYIPPIEGYEDTFKDWNKKIKGDYPYQVINPHYLRRSHAILDNVKWLQEAWGNPVFISSNDAKAKGIADGDTVLLSSPHGKTLRQACVTECLMPGVLGLPHGSWVDIDEKTGIDTGGADNVLCGAIPTGQGTSGWNTCIVNLEKYTGTPIVPDVEKPQRIIF